MFYIGTQILEILHTYKFQNCCRKEFCNAEFTDKNIIFSLGTPCSPTTTRSLERFTQHRFDSQLSIFGDQGTPFACIQRLFQSGVDSSFISGSPVLSLPMTQLNAYKFSVVGSLLFPPVLNFFYLLANVFNNINFKYYGSSQIQCTYQMPCYYFIMLFKTAQKNNFLGN